MDFDKVDRQIVSWPRKNGLVCPYYPMAVKASEFDALLSAYKDLQTKSSLQSECIIGFLGQLERLEAAGIIQP